MIVKEANTVSVSVSKIVLTPEINLQDSQDTLGVQILKPYYLNLRSLILAMFIPSYPLTSYTLTLYASLSHFKLIDNTITSYSSYVLTTIPFIS